MNIRRPSRVEGSAFILMTLLVALISVATGSLFLVELNRSHLRSDYVSRMQSVYAAEGTANYVAQRIWSDFLSANGGASAPMDSFRGYLEGRSIAEQQWTPVALDPLDFGAEVEPSAQVFRRDGSGFTELRVRAQGSRNQHDETLEAGFRVEGETFTGFEFALFSNNISCSFCHAEIDSVRKDDGVPYPRVRVASLQDLQIRSGSADTRIAGSLYTMGKLRDKDGTVLTDLEGSSLQAYSFENGYVDPASKVLTDMITAPVDASGNPAADFFLYPGYPAEASQQTDGPVPTEFPAVFPDENGNRVVDESEFRAVAATAAGSAAGRGRVVAAGRDLADAALGALPSVAVNGTVEGNLVLTGTADNPIRLDGKVVVDGDVVIQGVVKGAGQILARGNIFVTGDVTYADGTAIDGRRTFGVASDGTTNLLSLASGGNILVGDYVTPKGGSLTDPEEVMTGYPDGGFGFTPSQYTIFNRNEWQRTQEFLPDESGELVANSTYDPNHTPRYYVLEPGSPAWVFAPSPYDDGDGKKKKSEVYWNPTDEVWEGKEHTSNFNSTFAVDPSTDTYVASTLYPTSDWLTIQQLKGFFAADNSTRPDGKAFQLDALIYTDGLAFTFSRKDSPTDGQLEINGAVVCRDLGVLSAGAFHLNYDDRLETQNGLDLTTSGATAVAMRRTYIHRRRPTLAHDAASD